MNDARQPGSVMTIVMDIVMLMIIMMIVMRIVMGIIVWGSCCWWRCCMYFVATNSNTRRICRALRCISVLAASSRSIVVPGLPTRKRMLYLYLPLALPLFFSLCVAVADRSIGFNELALISFQKLWHILMGRFCIRFRIRYKKYESVEVTGEYPYRERERKRDQ